MDSYDHPRTGVISKIEFCRFCHLLYKRHLVSGVGGNVAARAGREIFLSPSGYSLRDVEPGLVVTVDEEGIVLKGPNPTKDADMHLGILRTRSDAQIVLHVHGAHIVAATAMLSPGPNTLPPLTPGFVYYAHPLPMIPFMVPGTKLLAQTVVKTMTKGSHRAILLQNHGLVAVGRDFQEALNVAEEIDEAARIYTLTGGKGRTIPSRDIGKIR